MRTEVSFVLRSLEPFTKTLLVQEYPNLTPHAALSLLGKLTPAWVKLSLFRTVPVHHVSGLEVRVIGPNATTTHELHGNLPVDLAAAKIEELVKKDNLP